MSGGSERRSGDDPGAQRRTATIELGAGDLTPTFDHPSVLVAAADAEALAARAALAARDEPACDACGEPIVGDPAGSGLYVWVRSGELRYEEPPLCEACAVAIGLSAQLHVDDEDDEEG
jgi:hypothetical protein